MISKIKLGLSIAWIGLTTPLYSLSPLLVAALEYRKHSQPINIPNEYSELIYSLLVSASLVLSMVLCCGLYHKRNWAFRISSVLMIIGCTYAILLLIVYAAYLYSTPTLFGIYGVLKISGFLGLNYICFKQFQTNSQ
jgi:hypothetical protein